MTTVPHSASYPPAARARYLLIILMAATVVSYLDRQMLFLLVEPIKRTFAISDTQVSLLQGLAFVVFYSVMSIPLGYLVDRVNRRNLIIFGILAWSLSSILCGLAQNFHQLFLARVGVGAGEACLNPAAFSMLSDCYPPLRRGRAFGLFGAAGSVGSAASLFVGSVILSLLGNAAYVSLPWLGQIASWKVVFIAAGAPGLLIALLLLTVAEPVRLETVVTLAQTPATASLRPTLTGALRADFATFFLLLLIFALFSAAAYGASSWAATSYVRTFGLTLPVAGMIAGFLVASSLIGAVGGGLLGDRWARLGVAGGRLKIVVYSGVIGAIGICGWWLVDNLIVSVACGFVVLCMFGAATATGPTVLNEIVVNQLRGRVSALYLITIAVFGLALGPTAVGVVTDSVLRDVRSLRYSIVIVAGLAMLSSAALSHLCLRRYSRSVAAVHRGHGGLIFC